MQGIGPAGAASIADALQARQQLLSLVLAHNPLTSKGNQLKTLHLKQLHRAGQ